MTYALHRESAVEEEASAPRVAAPAVEASRDRRRRPSRDLSRRATWGWLLVVTILGGALRFWALDRPPIWGDEALTFSRVIGSYRDLLGVLRSDGFPPYHYSATWWLAQGCPLPWPTGAVHWAEVWSPGGASPWYDVSVPLPEVEGVALFEGGLTLTPFVLRFLPAVFGTVMVPAVYFLAAGLTRRRSVALTAAVLACCSAFLLNYSRDAKMYQQSWALVTLHLGCLMWWLRLRRENRYSRPAWWLWVASGLAMVGYNASCGAILAGEALVLLATAGPRRALGLGRWAGWLGLPLLLAATLPAWAAVSCVLGATAAVLAGIGAWATLGLAALFLVVVPAAAMLVRSGAGTRDARRHLGRLGRVPDAVPFLLGLLLIGLGPAGYYGLRGDEWPVVPDAVVFEGFNRWAPLNQEDDAPRRSWGNGPEGGIGWVRSYNAGRDFGSHVEYALSAFLSAWEWPRERDWDKVDPAARTWLAPATLAFVALLLIGLASRGPPLGRPALWWSAWLAVPLWAFWVLSRDAKAIEATAATLPTDWTGWPAWLWGSAAAGAGGLPLSWWLVVAAAVAGAIATVARFQSPAARALAAWRIAWPTLTTLALLLAVWAAVAVWGKPLSSSIWTPRYLGFAWPIFAVTVAVLLWRLPSRAVRWGALALMVGLNLGQHAARLYAGSEPPSDRVAADLLVARDEPAVGLFLRVNPPGNRDGGPGGPGAPGGGYPISLPTTYYAALADGARTWSVGEFRSWRGYTLYAAPFSGLARLPPEQFVAAVAREAGDDENLRRLVVWTSSDYGEEIAADPFIDALGDRWRPVSLETFPVRDHWTWERFNLVHRREYQRVEPREMRPDGDA